MLSVASVKFANPHSLSVNAHRCRPAFLRLSPEQQLRYDYGAFTNSVSEDDVFPDEYEEQ